MTASLLGQLPSLLTGHYGFAGSVSGSAWPSANLAIFVPFRLIGTRIARRFIYCTANNTGNMDIGIYDASGNLLVSTGAFAQGSTNTVIFVDCTDTVLPPGDYYLAMSCASATAQPLRSAGPGIRAFGVCQMAAAHPLPATATFAALAYDYFPAFGFSTLAADL